MESKEQKINTHTKYTITRNAKWTTVATKCLGRSTKCAKSGLKTNLPVIIKLQQRNEKGATTCCASLSIFFFVEQVVFFSLDPVCSIL